jgi:hypothetical protein
MLAEIVDVLGPMTATKHRKATKNRKAGEDYVSRRTAWTWTLRADFPPPVDLVSGGPVWRTSEIERWGKKHLPLPVGRPPAKAKPKGRGG